MLKYVVCVCKGCDVVFSVCDAWSCRCSCMGSMSFSSCRCCMCVYCVHLVAVLLNRVGERTPPCGTSVFN